MEYHEIENPNIQALKIAMESGDDRAVVDELIAMARYGDEPAWVEIYLLKCIDESSTMIKWGAIQALAELARRRDFRLNKETVIARLRAISDVSLQGIIEDALDDIRVYQA